MPVENAAMLDVNGGGGAPSDEKNCALFDEEAPIKLENTEAISGTPDHGDLPGSNENGATTGKSHMTVSGEKVECIRGGHRRDAAPTIYK